MKITYRKRTNEVVMVGQGTDNAALASLEVIEDPRMKQGYLMKVNNGIIEYEKPWWMLEQENEDQLELEFVEDIDKIQKAKDVNDLKPLLTKIITKYKQ